MMRPSSPEPARPAQTDGHDPRSWVSSVAAAVAPLLSDLGLRSRGRTSFARKTPVLERRFLLSERFPRYRDDPFRVYVAPVVHVLFPVVRALREQLSGEKDQPGFPTIGGSTGLFGSSGSLLEFGLATEDDIPAVTVRVQAEIVHVAGPFWDRFSSLAAVLAAAEANDPWIPPEPSWVIDLAAVTCILRGREAAIDLLRTRAPFLGPPRAAEVITRLSSLPEPLSFRRTKRT